jgi:hypothetical protein
VEAGGEKALAAIEQSYLDWALEGFSGYIAADDLYDGPFCVLSLVDNRTFKRIAYRVLDHDPTQDDIRQFFQDFQARLELRGLVVRGITTDGSALYPEPIQQVFGDVPHQICAFHVIAELTKAVLGAVAKVRKTLAGRKPKLSRDRPSKRARKAARQSKRIGQKVAELFEHRYLFMKHHLSPAEQKTIRRITRGLPVTHLAPDHGRGLPAVRSSLPHRHRLGQTGTAAPPRGPLQTGGQDTLELFSPNLEQALTSLDDKCLPAMSNAVERGNRRYRKMQKTVYSVRTQPSIRARIALDMLRDASAKRRADTTLVLHEARTG